MGEISFYFFLIAGFFSGVLGGMGMGGGTILIPALSILFLVPQKIAQSTNLLSFLPMSAFSLSVHIKNGYVCFKGLFPLVLSAVAFSLLGSFAATFLPSVYLKRSFGVFLCVLSLYQFFIAFKQFTSEKK